MNIENNLPKSALALYVKIYCKKRANKNKDNKILMKAMKSWLSLTNSDKQQFIKKFNEYEKNIKIAYAYYLKNAEPYLKVKKKLVVPDRNFNEENSLDHNVDMEQIMNMDVVESQSDHFDLHNHNRNDNKSTESIIPQNDEYEGNIHLPENQMTVTKISNNNNDGTLEEPTPPKVICGEQLFEMINSDKETDLTWGTLNKTQKRGYQNAVLKIKNQYLKDYKVYLEQLPSEKLYCHYKKICDQKDYNITKLCGIHNK